jgi:hypothetical protein
MFKNSKAHIDSKANKTDSVFYFNANIYNDPSPPQSAKVARFSQSISSGSVVDLPENYYLAIVRFAISHMLIPLYQFRDNFYYITIRVGGVDYTKPLIYDDSGNYSRFGYKQPIFYYSQLVFMINNALTLAYNDAVVAANLRSFIVYDENLERFAFYYAENGTSDIYMNSNLFQQLQLFKATFMGYNQPNNKDYRLEAVIKPQDLNLVEPIPGSGNKFIVNYQVRPALYLLNEVQSIVFTSTSINVTKEFIGKNDGQGNVGSLSIIADFVPDQSSGRDLSEYQYNVQGPPRLVNLTNTIPITEIDYQVGIRFRDGTIVPLYLEPGETCEVKFGFFKKSLYDNDFVY